MCEEGARQYLIGGEGVVSRADGEVAKRAQPGGVGVVAVADGDGGVFLRHHGVKGEAKGIPKLKDTELWQCSPKRRKTMALGSETG
jgi:hypothetical protein